MLRIDLETALAARNATGGTAPEAVARDIQQRVRRSTRLDCSVGIGHNKLQAKMATGFGKPAGVYRITGANWLLAEARIHSVRRPPALSNRLTRATSRPRISSRAAAPGCNSRYAA